MTDFMIPSLILSLCRVRRVIGVDSQALSLVRPRSTAKLSKSKT